jgi:hypothetical protein
MYLPRSKRSTWHWWITFSTPAVKTWTNRRGGKTRLLLWLEEVEYLVVLEDRRERWMLWTAYCTDRGHTSLPSTLIGGLPSTLIGGGDLLAGSRRSTTTFHPVIPAHAGIYSAPTRSQGERSLDSCFRRNDKVGVRVSVTMWVARRPLRLCHPRARGDLLCSDPVPG